MIMTPDTQRGVCNQDGSTSLCPTICLACVKAKRDAMPATSISLRGMGTSYASNSFNRNLGTSPEPRHHNPVERGHMLKEPQLL